MAISEDPVPSSEFETPRRDFLITTAGVVTAAGLAGAAWPLIDSLNPSAEVKARMKEFSLVEVNLAAIAPGQRATVILRRRALRWGRPVFIAHRTAAEIAAAQADDGAEMADPEPDSARTRRQEWLVVFGMCTYERCPLVGQDNGWYAQSSWGDYYRSFASGDDFRGKWDGWWCRCCASHFDTAGRVRAGLAKQNLEVPPHSFGDDGTLIVG